MTSLHCSYLSTDLGFDPRLHPEMVVVLPRGISSASFEGGSAYGTAEEIAEAMRQAGYFVEVQPLMYGDHEED